METSSFLARKTLGQPNYLLVAMGMAFVLALVPYGARLAVETSANRAEDWLPEHYAESLDLAWFRENFLGEQFVIVSWDGCTLGNSEKLDLFAKKLAAEQPVGDSYGRAIPAARWYSRIITGSEALRQMTAPPVNMRYEDALRRLEGTLVGPPVRGADGGLLSDDARTTCLVANLSPAAMNDAHTMRVAIERIEQIAADECDIAPGALHLGGPPIDNVAIDAEGRRMLGRMAVLTGLAGAALCIWRMRSLRLAAMALAVGAAAAGMSLAAVFYFGAFEVLGLGQARSRLGSLDAVLTALPALAYVLGLAGAIQLINHYRHVRRESGLEGAAEAASRRAWRPAAIAAATLALGLLALGANDILPIKRFGAFGALTVLLTLAATFGILPVVLHRFPLPERRLASAARRSRLSRAAHGIAEAAFASRGLTAATLLASTALLSYGLTRLEASVELLKLVDPRARLIRDYAWLESNLGRLAPVEVVLTVPPERRRLANEAAEQDGQQYRLTMLERVELVRQVHQRITAIDDFGSALSAATFAPPAAPGASTGDRAAGYVTNKHLESHRQLLVAGDYLSLEQLPGAPERTGRELWRISARIPALANPDGSPTDHAKNLQQLRDAVEPVLYAYQQRDGVIRTLHEQGKKLAGARVCVLFRAPDQAAAPADESLESLLARLLQHSGVAARGTSYFNLASFDKPGRTSAAADEAYRAAAIAALAKQDVVVLASAARDPAVEQLAEAGVRMANVAELPSVAESAGVAMIDEGGPRPIRAVFTGMTPLVVRTQRELTASMKATAYLAAGLMLAALVMLLRNVAAGVAAFVAGALPLAAVFGALGWAGWPVDIGMMMACGVALGVAIDGAVQVIAWFQRATASGVERRQAVRQALDGCIEPMLETTLIAGLGMATLAASSLVPMQHFGYLMLGSLLLGLTGDLLLLPAALASPLGYLIQAAPAGGKRSAEFRPAPTPTPATPRAASAPAPHFAPLPAPAALRPSAAGSDAPIAPAPLTGTGLSAEARREAAHGPHAGLHARLQELRRPTGDDASRTA